MILENADEDILDGEFEQHAAQRIESKAQEEEIQVFVSQDINGNKILGIMHEEKECYLNSRYDEQELVNNWCNTCDVENFATIAVVFGLANSEYIRALRRKNKEMFIAVIEPTYSVLHINVSEIGIRDIIDDEKIMVITGQANYIILYNLLREIVNFSNRKYTKVFVSPNYDRIFEEDLQEIRRIVKECQEVLIVDRNTLLRFGKEFSNNIAKNFVDCIEQYSLGGLIDTFEKTEVEDIPAILVSAGPSLDKNINDLKNAVGKTFIVAVDTALNSLAAIDVIPDMTITIDPHKPVSLFVNEKVKNVPMIFSLTANEQIKNVHSGMRIYQDSQKTLLNRYISRFKKKEIALETGGSVANDAFSLIRRLGFKTVIFVGQDLAYPEGKKHSEQAYGKTNTIDVSKKPMIAVEDINGNKVLTEYNMNMYRLWFEKQIERYSDIKYIDATEGGARIKGMEIMTLKEALERECKQDEKTDFKKIIEATPKYFDLDERNYILNDMVKLPEHFEGIRKQIKEGMKLYERLDEFNRKHKYTGKEFERIITKISELNNWLDEDDDMAFLHLYIAESDYQIRDSIYDEKENLYEEFKFIAENGKVMMKAFEEATHIVEDEMSVAAEMAKKKIGEVDGYVK